MPDTRKVNWMLEDFPDDLKQKCKQEALSRRQTLKAFVESVLRGSVEGSVADPHPQGLRSEPGHGSAQADEHTFQKSGVGTSKKKKGPQRPGN
jgi:hypothetical protein